MFLDALRRRNPDFLQTAVRLHANGIIPANSYVLDCDAIRANATVISREADRQSLTVYAMTKQLSRNPYACAAMRDGGIQAAVAVDMTCARAVVDAGLRLGHLGHLVQVPVHEAAEAASMAPDYWTVFSQQKAVEAAAACAGVDRRQNLLLRIQAPADTFYIGHEGGFPADDVLAVADYVDSMPGARFAGVTTFPALLFDESSGAVNRTHNMDTLRHAAARLRDAGHDPQVNAPGTNSSVLFASLAEAGATQVEPGHALTGTTPLHAIRAVFSLGREGIIHRRLGTTNRRDNPIMAWAAYIGFSAIVTFALGAWINPFGTYAFLGSILGLGIIVLYILMNIGLLIYVRRDHQAEFNIWRHAVLPVVGSLLMLLPIYGQLWPVPAWPYNLVPYLIVAWTLAGIGYFRYLRSRKPEMIDAMGRVWEPDPGTVG